MSAGRRMPVTTEVRISGIDQLRVRVVTKTGEPVVFELTAEHARALAWMLVAQADVVTYRKAAT